MFSIGHHAFIAIPATVSHAAVVQCRSCHEQLTDGKVDGRTVNVTASNGNATCTYGPAPMTPSLRHI